MGRLSSGVLGFLCLAMAAILPADTIRAEETAIGFRLLTHAAPEREGEMEIAVWYPSADHHPVEALADNPAFQGVAVVPDGEPVAGLRADGGDTSTWPVVLLSHGFGGNWTNQLWLVEPLVSVGAVVAAPNHPGTTTSDIAGRPAEEVSAGLATALRQRSSHLDEVLDALADDAVLGAIGASAPAAAIGHSLGGWTVVAALGGRFDPSLLAEDCRDHPGMQACQIGEAAGLVTEEDAAASGAGMEEPWDRPGAGSNSRLVAGVSLDAGLVRGFQPDSLATITTPILVLGAGAQSTTIPVERESGYLAEHLDPDFSQFAVIDGAAHSSFIRQCKPGGADLIAEDSPGDEVVCLDDGRDRQDIHAETVERILTFLAEPLGLRQ